MHDHLKFFKCKFFQSPNRILELSSRPPTCFLLVIFKIPLINYRAQWSCNKRLHVPRGKLIFVYSATFSKYRVETLLSALSIVPMRFYLCCTNALLSERVLFYNRVCSLLSLSLSLSKYRNVLPEYDYNGTFKNSIFIVEVVVSRKENHGRWKTKACN